MAGVDLKITCHQAERRSYQGFHVVPVKLSPRLMTFLNIALCALRCGGRGTALSALESEKAFGPGANYHRSSCSILPLPEADDLTGIKQQNLSTAPVCLSIGYAILTARFIFLLAAHQAATKHCLRLRIF